jgi:hypothetical protein
MMPWALPAELSYKLRLDEASTHVETDTVDDSRLVRTALEVNAKFFTTDIEHTAAVYRGGRHVAASPEDIAHTSQSEAEFSTTIGGHALVTGDAVAADAAAVALSPAHGRIGRPEDVEDFDLSAKLQGAARGQSQTGQGNQHTQGKKKNLFHRLSPLVFGS